ncbi:flagellar basal body-associated FliL family protein [Enterococcus italicus]|uniref:flagellar basal body-associated FliL family protein n=1 Tax=Enterococcus italicus TaxID=246144 RepID=UPI0028A5BF55|nr:flagellar basal body-associated FliL family protein [Enterococcus italicus]
MVAREPKTKKETKLPMLLIIIIAFLAIGGSIGGTLIANKFLSVRETKTTKEHTTSSGKISEDEVIVTMDEFLVNLAQGKSNKQQYIRVKMSLLTNDSKDSENLTKNIAVARDSVVNILRQKKSEDILSTADSVTNLKKQLKEAINTEYGTAIVKEVFITDLVIQ